MASTPTRKPTKSIRKVRTYRSTDAEELRIATCAEEAGMPRCTWVREAAKRSLPRLAEVDRKLLRRLRNELRSIGINLNQLVRLAHVHKIQSSRSFREILRQLTGRVDEARAAFEAGFERTERP